MSTVKLPPPPPALHYICHIILSGHLWSPSPFREFQKLLGPLMRPYWPKVVSLAQKTSYQLFLVVFFNCVNCSQGTFLLHNNSSVDKENRHSGWVDRASALWSGGCGFDPPLSHVKYFKMVLGDLSFSDQHLGSRAWNQNRSAQCQNNVIGWNIMSSICGVIFQRGGTLQVSIELPATSINQIWMKDCWKRRKARIKQTNKQTSS